MVTCRALRRPDLTPAGVRVCMCMYVCVCVCALVCMCYYQVFVCLCVRVFLRTHARVSIYECMLACERLHHTRTRTRAVALFSLLFNTTPPLPPPPLLPHPSAERLIPVTARRITT